jgi:hypothetical protein
MKASYRYLNFEATIHRVGVDESFFNGQQRIG